MLDAAGGVAHPPGYPLWLLLAKGALGFAPSLGVADKARALNLLSSALSSCSAGLLASTVRALATHAFVGGNGNGVGNDGSGGSGCGRATRIAALWGGVLAAGLYAFSAGVWEF